MADWWDLAGKAGEYWLKDKQTGDVEANQMEGYSEARKDINRYAQPYQGAAEWGIEGYKKEGPFDFTYEGYLSSPEFQWMQDQTRQARERGAAAGQQGLYSGQTLADLNRDLYNVTAQGYGDEFNRQLKAQQAREGYWWTPVTTGANVAARAGESLAAINLERGEARARFAQTEANQLNEFLSQALGMGADGDQNATASLLQDAWEAIGGEEGWGGDIVSFAKEVLAGGGELLDDLGLGGIKDAAGQAWDWATGASAIASGAIEGWSAVPGMSSNWVMNDAGFLVDLSSEAATAAGEGIAQAGTNLGADVLNFLSSPGGFGITAAAITLLTGGDVKDAAITGGVSYLGAVLGSAIMPGIGTAIGGALGGLAASFGLGDEQAKTDSVMGFIAPDQDYMAKVESGRRVFKDGVYSEGPWGAVGFWGSGTRHIDVDKSYQQAFDVVTRIDSMISEALTPEENQAVIDQMSKQLKGGVSGYTFRDERNEGKVSAMKVLNSSLQERSTMLKQALGEARYNELQLGDLYDAALANLG